MKWTHLRRIGFIGLGIMGKPMSMNLLRAGFSLTVFDVAKSRIRELVSQGAIAAKSPREVAERSEILITMLPRPSDVEEVLLGPNGAIQGGQSEAIFIDMGTGSPSAERKIGRELIKKGIEILDAPVSGGDVGAMNGTLTIMVGGKKQTFNECLPVFERLGREIVYAGELGSGQTLKLCNQVLVSVNILAACEALMLGKKAGLDEVTMLKVLTKGAGSSWQLSYLAPRILRGDFEPGFKVGYMQKDLELVSEMAHQLHLTLPGSKLVRRLYHKAEENGMSNKGTQALFQVLEGDSKQ